MNCINYYCSNVFFSPPKQKRKSVYKRTEFKLTEIKNMIELNISL